ncbi:MAG: SpoIIE family protein phosphatase [Nitrospiraceae bacterium]|nr:SpoIIE family protein phosphatase [Nitrospiraceae bacterium]
MIRSFLVRKMPDGTERRESVGDGTIIGRTDDSGFVIDDSAASRRHAEIKVRGNSFYLCDLGSTNGTQVNGRRMLEADLHDGDLIAIGDTELRFETEEAADDVHPMATFVGTIIDGDSEMTVTSSGDRSEALFQAIYTVTNAIASNYEPCNLIDRILETTVEAIHAQRGALFLQKDGELSPCPVCGAVHAIRDGQLARSDMSEIRVSRTVAQRVLQGGESVLFQDADEGEFAAAESIVSLNLRSIICAPLRAKSGILGILYIDTDRASHAYTEDDMLLSSAVANSAGLAIENAHMHQELLEKQRMEQEIEFAWTIQEGFLVKDWPQDCAEFDVYGETRPAKVVGGDFYDFVRPLPGCVGILIGDVSGKGVPAALSMAQLLAQFRLCAQSCESPAKVLEALNEDLAKRSQRGMFCTLCYILLDLRTGQTLCANAGHHPVLHIQASGVGSFGEATGPPAGILPVAPWVDTDAELAHGDSVLLYTDGVAEARRVFTGSNTDTRSGEPDEYGLEGLYSIAERTRGLGPRELIDAINEDVLAYCAPEPPHDDCTMIAVRYLGSA